MSGGFFRGTSADQDTRFSNKQAKLMKSQKFAPELDHLIDVSKVKMDVIKPWIATRVTQLLGFEDEVLINFIYGLLDKKDVNGKEVQIQITGFMEKNTGKFMKELWGLLLSAQNNASGVPQQFLDAKEEEIRKKKVETDRITLEIQKKKEFELEKQKKMDEAADISKAGDDAANRAPKHSAQHEDDKGSGERNGFRGKNRSSRSPRSVEHSPSPDRDIRSRSISKSFSNSRSYSDDRHKSRSLSRSPQSRGRSISPVVRYRSPRKRSLSPRRNYSPPRRPRSPLRRRSPHSRRRPSPYSWRRSPSPRRRRSPSPRRRRRSPSPRRRRSPSPRGRRSPSPVLRKSPSLKRRRSPTPVRRRSPTPVRRRSPTPVRRRSSSIMRRRSPSPVRRRSPLRRRSPSPLRRRSPSPVRRRSPIPIRRRSPSQSPLRGRSPSPVRRRSPPRSPRQRRKSPLQSPGQRYRSGSPPYRRRRSLSRDYDDRANGVGSRRYRDDYASERSHGKKSPTRIHERDVEQSGQRHKRPDSVARHPTISMRSPQRDLMDQSDAGRKMPISLTSRGISPSHSGSSLQTGKSSPSEDRRTSSPSEGRLRSTRGQGMHADSVSPVRQTRNMGTRHDSHGTVREEGIHSSRVDGEQGVKSSPRRTRHSPSLGGNRNIPTKDSRHEEYSLERLAGQELGEADHPLDDIEIRRKDRDRKSEKVALKMDVSLSPIKNSPQMMKAVEYGPGRVEAKRFSPEARNEFPAVKQQNSPSPRKSIKSYPREDYKVDEKKRAHSDSENEKDKLKDVERRKHKRQDRHHMASDDDTSSDSHIDEKKEAKRRRKEEKRLRKEEKRRRREERHRRREERRAGKLKARTMDTVIVPSDAEKNQSDAYDSDDHVAAKMILHPSDTEEAESEQKRLEIELRKKALESLRAKKAINS